MRRSDVDNQAVRTSENQRKRDFDFNKPNRPSKFEEIERLKVSSQKLAVVLDYLEGKSEDDKRKLIRKY